MIIAWEKLKKEDLKPIAAIAKRAVSMARELGFDIKYQTMEMDVSACHITNPLRLADLLAADDSNFSHDVFGIRKYINRETGELTECFSPRFSQ